MTIGIIIKYFRFTYDYILWGISWTNVTMLLRTIPTDDDEPKEEEKTINSIDELMPFLNIQ